MAYDRKKNAVLSSTPGAKPSLVPQSASKEPGASTNVKVTRAPENKESRKKGMKVYNGTAIYPGQPD